MSLTWDQIKGWTYDELYAELYRTPEVAAMREGALAALRAHRVAEVRVANSGRREPHLQVFLASDPSKAACVVQGYGRWDGGGRVDMTALEQLLSGDPEVLRSVHIQTGDAWTKADPAECARVFAAYVGPGKRVPKVPTRCRESTIVNGTSSRRGSESLSEWLTETFRQELKEEAELVQARLRREAADAVRADGFEEEYRRLRTQFAVANVARAIREWAPFGREVLSEAVDLVYVQEVMES